MPARIAKPAAKRKPTATRPSGVFRRGTKPSPKLSQPDFPYTMKLRDGRTLLVEIPGRWVTADRDGSPAFEPAAVRFLDRVRAAFMNVLDRPPSPGYLTTLREALGLTQAQLGEAIGVDKITVSRWERGSFRPNKSALMELERLRKDALSRGVAIAG